MRRIHRAAFVLCLALAAFAAPAHAEDGIIPLGGTVEDALDVRVTGSALDFTETIAEQILSTFDIEAMIMAENPIFEDGFLCGIEGNVTGMSYGSPSIDIATTPFPGQPGVPNALFARFIVPDLAIDINIEYDTCLWSDDFDVEATADDVTGLAVLQIVYRETEEGAHIGVELVNVDAAVHGFDLDLGLGILEPIFDIFNQVIENAINDIVREMIPDLLLPIIEEYLSQSLPLSGEFPIGETGITLIYDLVIDRLFSDATGMSIEFEGAIYIDGVSDCVDLGPQPGSRWTDNPKPVLTDELPGGGPYHIGLSVADDLLNQAAYSTYASGLLCLTLDSSFLTGGLMSSRTFERLAPAIVRLPGGGAALADDDDDTGDDDDAAEEPEEGDVIFVIQPHQPPIIDIGDGAPDLIVGSIDELEVSMYEYVSERWVRTLGLLIDVEIGVGVDLADSVLYVVIEQPVIDYEILYNEYSGLDESGVDGLIEAMLVIVWPMLMEALEEGFELPGLELPGGQMLGYSLDYAGPIGIADDFLGVFLSFSVSDDKGPPDTRVILRSARTGRDASFAEASLDLARSGEYGLADALNLFVRFDGDPPPGAAGGLEYSYRLDGGFWSRFSPEPGADLPRTFEGPHVLEVRTRARGGAVDPTPARIAFIADGVAPRILSVSVEDAPEAGVPAWIEVTAEDWRTPAPMIRYSISVDGGAWSAFVGEDGLRVPGLPAGAHELAVRAADEAGNVSPAAGTAFEVAAGAPPALGCGMTGSRGVFPLAVLVLAAFLGWRARSRGN